MTVHVPRITGEETKMKREEDRDNRKQRKEYRRPALERKQQLTQAAEGTAPPPDLVSN